MRKSSHHVQAKEGSRCIIIANQVDPAVTPKTQAKFSLIKTDDPKTKHSTSSRRHLSSGLLQISRMPSRLVAVKDQIATCYSVVVFTDPGSLSYDFSCQLSISLLILFHRAFLQPRIRSPPATLRSLMPPGTVLYSVVVFRLQVHHPQSF